MRVGGPQGTEDGTRGATESAAPPGRSRWGLGRELLVVVAGVDAEEALELLLGGVDVLVVLAARLLADHVVGLVETGVHEVFVLAGELLGLLKEIRHGFFLPWDSRTQYVPTVPGIAWVGWRR